MGIALSNLFWAAGLDMMMFRVLCPPQWFYDSLIYTPAWQIPTYIQILLSKNIFSWKEIAYMQCSLQPSVLFSQRHTCIWWRCLEIVKACVNCDIVLLSSSSAESFVALQVLFGFLLVYLGFFDQPFYWKIADTFYQLHFQTRYFHWRYFCRTSIFIHRAFSGECAPSKCFCWILFSLVYLSVSFVLILWPRCEKDMAHQYSFSVLQRIIYSCF